MSNKYDSNWEQEYAQLLFISKRAKIIADFVRCKRKGEEHTLKVMMSNGKPIKYTPDFWVTENDGSTTLIEVKGVRRRFTKNGKVYGGQEDKAGIKNFQHFSIHCPQYHFRMVTKKAGACVTLYDLNKEKTNEI